MHKMIVWQNKVWVIWFIRACDKSCCKWVGPQKPYMMLEYIGSKRIGFCDYPIQYDDGRISYDWPERIPAHINKQVERQFKKAFK